MNKSIASITSPHNETVKAIASLQEKKHRDRSGKFAVEGVHLVKEALIAGAAVERLLFDRERGVPNELRPLLAESRCELIETTAAILGKCAGTDTPPPVIGVVAKRAQDTAALYGERCLVVVLDGVRDPGNAGTIIRSADAAGADAVLLGHGCVDLYNPKTVRSTMGSLFHLPIVEGDLGDYASEAKRRGIRLVGTSLQATGTCYDYNWREPTWLLLGNESEGLSDKAREFVDDSVIIPMRGRSESLNVAMAATVLLYEALRQRDLGVRG